MKKSLEKIKDSFSKGNDTLQSLISEIFNRDEKIDDDLNDELLKTQEILAYLNDNYLEREELLFEGKNTSVDDDYLEQSVDNFIQFLSRNIAEMDNKQRKIRMRRLLCITDFPFENPEEFFNYLKSSLEVNANKEDMIASINLAAEVMARYVKGE